MKDYRSPFLLPEQPKKQNRPPECTKPDHALKYPNHHSKAGEPGSSYWVWGKECPVHSRRKTAQNTRNKSDPWLAWYKYREEYAKLDSGSDDYAYRESVAKARMLATVTAVNPPDVPFEPRKTWHQYETQLFGMHVQYWVLAVAVAVWAGFSLVGIFLP